MPSLALCSENEKTEPTHSLWYHGTMSRIPLACLSLQLKETTTPFGQVKKANGGMVHQMSKEEDCPQEQKLLSGRAFSSRRTFSSCFCLMLFVTVKQTWKWSRLWQSLQSLEKIFRNWQSSMVSLHGKVTLQRICPNTRVQGVPGSLPSRLSPASCWESSGCSGRRTQWAHCSLYNWCKQHTQSNRSPFTCSSWCHAWL